MRETYQPPTISPPALRTTTLPARRRSSQPSTEIDTMRQSPTNHNENSCPPARGNSVPFPFSLGMDCDQVAGDQRTAWSCRPLAVMPIDQTETKRLFARRQRVTD